MTTTAPRAGVLRHLQLNVKILESGAIILSTPQVREWTRLAQGPDQLWHALQLAMARARLAGHATWCEPPAPVVPAAVERNPDVGWSKRAAARPDVTDTAEWTPLPDGTWLSPGGKRYRSQRILQPIIARRAALGLPTSYEAAAERFRQVEAAAAEVPEARRFWERVESCDPESRWHTTDRRNAGRVAS